MVGMIAIGAMVGVGVEAEVVAPVAAEGEGTMVHRMSSKMVASTIKKLPCRDEVELCCLSIICVCSMVYSAYLV